MHADCSASLKLHIVGFPPEIKVGTSHITKCISRAQIYTLTNNSKHGDAAVLQFDLPKSVERVLLPAVGHVERIPEAEGSLSSDLTAQIAGEGGGRGTSDGLVGRRSEGGTACDDGGEYEGGLHLCFGLGVCSCFATNGGFLLVLAT